ncbi:MAG: outer membrane lipoprotein carrier protein LolA [Alphaproteobacteria bacterium]|nr:outer membrane lipoprotein carrier protein LolA [Alphaproteobacteria bacterium]
MTGPRAGHKSAAIGAKITTMPRLATNLVAKLAAKLAGRHAGRLAVITGLLAVTPAGAALGPEDAPLIAAAEESLNALRSLEARFTQVSTDGGFAHGRIYLRRPGRIRLDYAPPAQLQVYGDGFWLIYVDTELKQVSRVPLSSTPAAVLVRDRISLSGELTATRVERGANGLRVHLVQTKEPGVGTVILGFAGSPLALYEWVIVDPKGVRTTITLVDPHYNVPLGPEPFVFDETPYERRIE